MQIQKLSKTVTGKYNLIVLLPENYYNNTDIYPFVLCLVGIAAKGDNIDALMADIPKVVYGAVDKGFIVVAVQTPDTYDDEILFAYKYAFDNFRCDYNHKYMFGFSYGGGGVWNFIGKSVEQAKMFDAVIPIATTWTNFTAKNVADAGLMVWAFHNMYDSNRGTPCEATKKFCEDVNKIKPGLATMTLFNSTAHGGWSEALAVDSPPIALNGEGLTNPSHTVWDWFLMNTSTTRVAPKGYMAPVDLAANATFNIKDGIVYLDGTGSFNYKSAKWTLITAPTGVNKWGVNITGGGWITGSFTPPTNGRYIIRLSVYPETGYGGTPVSTDLTIDYNVEAPVPIPKPVFTPNRRITFSDNFPHDQKVWDVYEEDI